MKFILRTNVASLEDLIALSLGREPKRQYMDAAYRGRLHMAKLYFGSGPNPVRVDNESVSEQVKGSMLLRPREAFAWISAQFGELPAGVQDALAKPAAPRPTALAAMVGAITATEEPRAAGMAKRDENSLQTAQDILALIVLNQFGDQIRSGQRGAWTFLPAVGKGSSFQMPDGITSEHHHGRDTVKQHVVRAIRQLLGEERFRREFPKLAKQAHRLKDSRR